MNFFGPHKVIFFKEIQNGRQSHCQITFWAISQKLYMVEPWFWCQNRGFRGQGTCWHHMLSSKLHISLDIQDGRQKTYENRIWSHYLNTIHCRILILVCKHGFSKSRYTMMSCISFYVTCLPNLDQEVSQKSKMAAKINAKSHFELYLKNYT